MIILKQIIKWFSGGFFRRLGSIFAFIVIGMLIALFMSKNDVKLPNIIGFDYVNAATITPATDTFLLQFCSDRTCDYSLNGSTYYRDYVNKGTSYTNSNHYYFTSIRFKQTFSSSNYLNNGTMYQIKYGFHIDPKYNFSYYNVNSWAPYLSIVDSNNETHQLQNSEFSCNFANVNNATGILVTCLFTPFYNVQTLLLRINFPYTLYSDYSGYSGYIFKSQNTINYTSSSIEYSTSTNDAINNQTTIINNNINNVNENINNLNNSINDSTNTIINNQNENTQAQIDSQKVCQFIDKNNIEIDNTTLYSDGSEHVWTAVGVTSYISIDKNSEITFLSKFDNSSYFCFYNINKEIISCYSNASVVLNEIIDIPNNASYMRFTINKQSNIPTINICKNGNQALTDTLTDSDTTSDSNDMADFLNNMSFNKDSAISSILTIPIDFIQSIFLEEYTNDLCFTLKGVQSCLPNGKIIWNKTGECNSLFGCANSTTIAAFRTFFELVVGGYICYKLLIGVVRTYEQAIDPLNNGAMAVMKL